MSKISLVLEGGGMRGAYTAGCLSWLIDHNIEFDNAYGISTGAVHLCSFLLKDKDALLKCSTEYIASREVVGLRSFLREGKFVSYDYLFHTVLKEHNYNFDGLKNTARTGKVGLYNMEKGLTEYYPTNIFDAELLKAACSLPIIGKIVHFEGKKFLDGGITEMIPIKEAKKDGNERFIVITTKPIDFVRKPAHFFVKFVMKLVYLKYPSVEKDYAVRHLNYNDQISLINEEVKKGTAAYLYPSVSIPVSRLRGDKKDLIRLFELGYSDMEARKESIMKIIDHD